MDKHWRTVRYSRSTHTWWRRSLRAGFLAALLTFAGAPGAQAAIALRAASTASLSPEITFVGEGGADTSDGGCPRSVSPAVPAGNVDDLLIALVVAREDNATVGTPAGWTQLYADTYPGGQEFQVFIFYRVANGSDSITVTESGTCGSLAGRIARFRGVDTAQPFLNVPIPSGNVVTQNANNIDTGTEITVAPDAMLLVASFVTDNNGIAEGGGWVASFESAHNLNRDLALNLHYQLQTTAGAKSVSNWSIGAQDENYGIIFSLRPAPAVDTLTIAKPAGTTTDDVMVASIAVTSDSVGITPPADWTLVQDSLQAQDAGSHLATYVRVVTDGGSEPATYAWTLSGTHAGAVGAIATFSGVDPNDPVVTSGAQLQNGDTATTHTAPSLAASAADMLVTTHEYQSSGTWSPPAGMTEVPGVDLFSGASAGAGGVSLGMNYQLLTTTGVTGGKTATASGNGDEGASHALALKPIPLICYSDDFNRANGSPGADWAVSSASGTFGPPTIFNNRLRLTDASGSVSTMATLQRIFPGAGNSIQIEFEHFADSGSGADGIALVLSDSALSPVPGAFGGSLGYAQKGLGSDCPNCPGFVGGWLGVGIDEYGNFSNPTEGRSGGPGQRADSVSVRGSGSGQTGYVYHTGTGTLAPQVDNNGSSSPAHRYRIIADHSNSINTWVSVERDTGGGYVTLVAPYDASAEAGQAAMPASWILSWTGSTGGLTNIHEIDNLQICAIAQTPISAIDHLEIEHASGSGLTCTPSTLTIRACASADCSSTYTGGVTGTLTASGAPTVNWVGGAGFSIPAGADSVDKEVQVTTPGSVVFGTQAGSVTPAPNGVSPACNFGTPSCTFTATDTGFIFDVPDHTSDTVQNVTVSAVRKDLTSDRCVPAFAGANKSVGLWSTYLNPATGTLPVRIDGSAVAGSSPGTATGLSFDANGQASISLQYADVGEVRLNALYAGSGVDEAGLVMTGDDPFVARPARFALVIAGNPAAADAGGGKFKKAGEPFPIQAEARNASGAVAPNYGRETPAESVGLTSALVAPAGASPGVFTGSFGSFGLDCSGGSGTGGVACGNFSWSEVGIIDLTPSVGDSDYLGTGDITGTASGNVGRFYPARLAVADNAPVLDDACVAGDFTYLGQEFPFLVDPVLTVTALNAAGGTASNYGGSFWKLATALAGRSYSNAAATLATLSRTTSGGNAILAGAGDYDGSGTLTVTGDRLTYDKLAEEPFFDASVHLDFTEGDLTDDDDACYDPENDGSCNIYRISPIGGTQLRWGRLSLANAYGSELVDLRVPMQAEFFIGDATGFLVNGADSCTAVTLTLADGNGADGLVPGETCVYEPGNQSGFGCASPPPPGKGYVEPPAAGVFNLWFQAPGGGNAGSLDVTAQGPLWLRYDWRNTGVNIDPAARLTFGIFKGNPRHIYLRETFR